MESSDFQTDVEKAAREYAVPLADEGDVVYFAAKFAYIKGAQYGRSRGFQEAVELLRSDAILKYPRPDGYGHRMTYAGIADWLEKRKELK